MSSPHPPPAERDRAPRRDAEDSPGQNAALQFRAAALFVLGACLGSATCGLAVDFARSPLEHVIFSTLGIQFFLGFSAFAGAAMTREPIAARLGLGRGRLPWSLVLLAALGTLGLSHAVDSALSLGGLREESILSELDGLLGDASGRALLFAILGLGIAPGICEELLCRGLLQRGLARRCAAPAAVGIGALVFGAMHLEWIQGSAATLLGLYLGAIAFRAGSIRPAIFCHCCNNLGALAVGVLGLGGDPSFASAALGLAAAAVACGAIFLHRRSA